MSDWRENDKPAKKSPKKNSPAPPSRPVSSSSGGGDTEWRSSKATKSSASNIHERSWTDMGVPAPKARLSRKVIGLATVGLVLCAALIYSISVLMRGSDRLPLFVSSETNIESRNFAENPFGQETLDSFRELSGLSNLELVVDASDNRTKDNFLENLVNEKWQKKFLTPEKGRPPVQFSRDKLLLGKGPGRPTVAFFISALCVKRPASAAHDGSDQGQSKTVDGKSSGGSDSDIVLLLPTNRAPFAASSAGDSDRFVTPEHLLKQICAGVDPGALIWLTLDLRFSEVIANPSEIQQPIATQFKECVKRLDDHDQRRLIVTLPCEDDQQNWLCPELGCTAFAYQYRRGLAGGFSDGTILGNVETLEHFKKSFDQGVTEFVAERRYAAQKPVWITHFPESEYDSVRLFSTTNVHPSVVKPKPVAGILAHFDQIDQLWATLGALSQMRYVDPVAYAEVEVRLLHLESLAERKSAQFSSYLEEAQRALGRLQKPAGAEPPRVSLIEYEAIQREFSQTMLTAAADRLLAATDLETLLDKIGQPVPEGKADTLADSLRSLNRDERSALVFKATHKAAMSNNQVIFRKVFRPASLSRLLDYIDAAPKGTDWLEIHMLRLLRSELPWPRTVAASDAAPSSFDAFADQLTQVSAEWFAGFCRSQRVATGANREFSFHLRESILETDRSVLNSFDLLSAGRTSEAESSLAEMRKLLDSVETARRELEEAMIERDDGFYHITHDLIWALQRYQFADEGEEKRNVEETLNRLAKMFTTAVELKRRLNPSELHSAEKLERVREFTGNLRAERQEVKQRREDFVVNLVSDRAASNSLTIRNLRLALRMPTLPMERRLEFHKKLASYLEEPLQSQPDGNVLGKGGKSPVNRNLTSAVSAAFRDKLKESDYTDWWVDVLTEDPRWRKVKSFSSDFPKGDVLNGLYDLSYRIRLAAPAFAQDFDLNSNNQESIKKKMPVSWPWSAPRQVSSVALAEYERLQRDRLGLAAWGRGTSDASIDQLDSVRNVPFGSWALFYRSARDMEEEKPAGDLIEDRWSMKEIDDAFGKLKSLAVDYRLPEGIDAQRTTPFQADVIVDGSEWNATAAAYFAGGNATREIADPQQALTFSLSGKETDKRHAAQFQPMWIPQSTLRLAVRGNYVDKVVTLPPPRKENEYRIAYQAKYPATPAVVVKPTHVPKLNVMLLLDCSDSTKGGLMGNFKLISEKLLRKLDLMVAGGEADIQVRLICFGLWNEQVKNTKEPEKNINDPFVLPSMLKSVDRVLPNLQSNQIFLTDKIRVGAKDKGFLELSETIHSEGIRSSGCTPLYDALFIASKLVEKDRDTQIIVITDGVNFCSPTYYHSVGLNKPMLEAKQSLTQSGGNVLVYMMQDVEKENSKASAQSPGAQTSEQKSVEAQKKNDELKNKEKAEAALRELIQLIGENHYHSYSSADKLAEGVENALPRPRVALEADGRMIVSPKFFGQEMTLPQEDGKPPAPRPYKADVVVTFKDAAGSEAQVRKPVVFEAGETFRLFFDANEGTLRYSSFKEAEPDVQKASPLKPDPDEAGPGKYHVLLQPRTSTSSDGVQFKLMFRVPDETEKFTYRPKFVFAELESVPSASPRPGELTLKRDILDFSFFDRKHYPELESPGIPWGNDSLNELLRGKLTVYASAARPEFVQVTKVEPQESVKPAEGGGFTIVRKGRDMDVQVPAEVGNHMLLRFPGADEITRTYGESGRQSITVRYMQSKAAEPIEVEFFDRSNLRDAVTQGTLQIMSFPPFTFGKN